MSSMDFSILDKVRLRYNIDIKSGDSGWSIKLMNIEEDVIWVSENDTFENCVASLKVFWDSSEEIHRLEDEIKANRLKRDMEEYDLQRKLEAAKNKLKYSDKISIPTMVVSKEYVSCDFCTYGKCPSCEYVVKSGMGGKDEECPNCCQKLIW